ncbi:hypothetical protein AAHH67_01590 [Niallia circulans]
MRKGDYVKKQNLRRWFIIIFVISVFVILFVFLNAKTKVKVTQQMDDTITQYIKDKYKDVYNENEKHKQFEAHKVYGAEKNTILLQYTCILFIRNLIQQPLNKVQVMLCQQE